MKVKFADTFLPSLQRMIDSENPWHWRYYRELYYDVKRFIENLPGFLKLAWSYVPWEHEHNHLEFLLYSLPRVEERIHRGYEIESSANVKRKHIQKCIRICKRLHENDYTDIAARVAPTAIREQYDESYTGFLSSEKDAVKENANSVVYLKCNELYKRDWRKLHYLLRNKSQGWWS